MTHTARILITTCTIIAGLATVGNPFLVGLATAKVDPAPALVVHGASPEHTELLSWATERFTEAGLDLPPLDVSFHNDESTCGGSHGSFREHHDVAIINICNPRDHIILHELAHAWVASEVGDEDRERFMHDLGLISWNDPDVAWSERGTERAANMISLVLDWDPSSISSADGLPRLCGYQTLTGQSLTDAIPVNCADAR